jgi:hypothetical protein
VWRSYSNLPHSIHRHSLSYYQLALLDVVRPVAVKTSHYWDLDGSLFFALTVVATIGYGSPQAPVTAQGRVRA